MKGASFRKFGRLCWLWSVCTFTSQMAAAAPPVAEEQPEPAEESFSLHYQATVATQAHPAFHAKYSGQNSMSSDAESATATVTTLYSDLRLWRGSELIFDPELSGGRGLSRTLGVAAFPSGIVYRVGNPSPTIYPARLVLRQTFGLGGGTEDVEPGPNQLAGKADRDHLTISLGRLAVTDVFDGNAYAHDPTTQFFNWALFASGAWDYPADTRGYTWGLLSDLSVDWWSVRAGITLLPKYGNLLPMEWRIDKARALMAEYEARYSVLGRSGSARLLLFLNDARMGSYEQVTENRAAYDNEISATRAFGRKKYGFAISVDQRLTRTLGGFLRLSYNDGANETWAFTEIDRSLGVGLVQNGSVWSRPLDDVGAAIVVNGISNLHRRYLEGGGYGFLIGDGALRYGPEMVGDLYYRAQITREIALSGVYQPIVNPAYNRDRGPVHVFSARLRVAF
jgi:high affinity Mn2+ porin